MPDFVLIYDDLVWIVTIDAHKMPQDRHFGAGSDTMQQVYGVGVKRTNYYMQIEIGYIYRHIKNCYSEIENPQY